MCHPARVACGCIILTVEATIRGKLQALVYDILPLTTAVFSYTIGSRKLSANGGQLCGDKECPFSGVTKFGRVWRRVPESDAWSVH